MADKNSKDQGEGLFSKVLLPGYADSGASTAFQTFRPNRDPTNENEDTNKNDNDEFDVDVDVDDNDKVSEATTALHDNRTTATTSDAVSTPQNGTRVEFHSKYGFFPSTKPPQISPRPSSPPTVTRRQLPIAKKTFSVAGTSVIPETGGSFDVHLRSITIERQNQIQITKDGSPSNNGSLPISTNDSSDNDNDEEQMGKNEEHMELSSSHSRSTCTENSSSGRGDQCRETSMIKDDDEDRDKYLSSLENDRLSEVPSDVLSTASEMGTVINIGSDRMAEIDAMAALAESSPADYDVSDSRSTTANTSLNKDLSLPVLEAQPSDPTLPLPKNTLKQSTSLEKNMNFATSNREKSPTTSEMVSKAIRRIGPALNRKNSNSAPTTPRTPGLQPPRVEDLLKSTLTPRSNTSFAMRSPGSSSRQSMQAQKTATTLTPRFTSTKSPSWLQQQQSTPRSMDYVVSDDLLLPQCNDGEYDDNNIPKTPLVEDYSKMKQATSSSMSPIDPSLLLPVRLAQRCFSFDNTVDELNSSNNPANYHSGNVKILPRVDEQQQQKQQIRSSQSWDVVRSRVDAPAFRSAPHQLKFGPVLRNTKSQDEQARTRVDSDFSPTKMDPNSAIELKTPQRIEIEREDALDILACLVERGATDWKTAKEPLSSSLSSSSTGTANGGPRDESNASDSVGFPISDSMIETTAEEFRKWSQEKPVVDTDNGALMTHSKHTAVLDELLRAHAYALEMKRASLSASSWLKSIGRFDGEHNRKTMTDADGAPHSSSGGQTSGEANDRNLEGTSKMEMITLNARLHRAEMELKGKTEANEKLNMELSKCRAEIGRLRSTTRNEHSHHSYNNRSILDDSNEEETSSTGGLKGYGNENNPSPIPRSDSQGKFFDESFHGNNSIFQGTTGDETNHQPIGETGQLDVFVMKSALEEANDRIRRLHEQLEKKDNNGEIIPSAPIVDIPEVSVKVPNREEEEEEEEERTSSSSSPAKDFHRTVNVKMLDGENFVTEWNDLTPPLPPPPDHGIRSPIVGAVLEQWTSDQSLHESLIGWIEHVMTEQDINASVQPLTISSLDHQVRDGFAMHVLPLLLRRADIHVSVQTRAHRTTKYDMSVTVSQKSYHQSTGVSKQHAASLLDHYVGEEWLQSKADESRVPSSGDSTFGASHSAVTEKAFNSSQFLRNHPSEMEQYSHFPRQRSGSDCVEEQQTGIMSALGGALGGLLSRRKFSAETSPSSEGYYSDALRSSMPAEMRAQMDLTSSPVHGSFPKEEDQPYHRVVSAPPGRIGVTFVEFRGHAMVSDVAPDGPLSSWVFPSDILIAIDEVPVSGMRVRNIIKVLTERRNRQRALRVISSHAMNEFTLKSTLNEEEDTD